MGFAALALICVVALLGAALSIPRRLRLPVVVGELAVGVVIGDTALGLLDPKDETFSFLAQVGFALVMVIAGSHVPLRDPALRTNLGVGAFRAVVIGALSVPAGLGLAQLFGTGHGWLYAVLLASSSASVVMPILDGAPTDAPVVATLLPQLAIADAACIVLLPLAIDPSQAVQAGLGVVAVILVAALLAVVLQILVRRGLEARLRAFSQRRGLALELRFWLAGVFAVAAVATAMNVSVMLAGFVCGLALAAAGEPRRMADQLFAVSEGLFAPIFFVWLGASLNLRELASHPGAVVLGLALGVAALAVHAVPILLRQAWPAAVITAAQLGVPVAAVSLGTSLDLLQPGEGAALLLGAILTLAGAALVASRVRTLAEQQRPAAATTAAMGET